MKENKSLGGRKPKASSKPTGHEIIRGLFECPEHDCPLWISGKVMYCKHCHRLPRERRYLHTQLNTSIAIKCLLEGITSVLQHDEKFLRESYEDSKGEIERMERFDPIELDNLKRSKKTILSKIKFAKANVGESESEQRDTSELIRENRINLRKIENKILKIESEESVPKEPLPEFEVWVAEFRDMAGQLEKCHDDFAEMNLGRIRRWIQLLIGERIKLIQCGENQPRKGWHEAEIKLCLCTTQSNVDRLDGDSPSRSLSLIFRRETHLDRQITESDIAYKLAFEEQRPRKEIGEIHGWSKSKVTNLIKFACSRRDQPFVAGRSVRGVTSRKTPLFESISQQVLDKYNDGFEFPEIAKHLQVSIDTIRKAFKFWHFSRGLDVPNTRKQAKLLQDIEQAYQLDREGILSRGKIAETLGCSPAKLTGLLKKAYQQRGEPFGDKRGTRNQHDQNYKFKLIAETVANLVNEGKSYAEVAKLLNVDRATVSKAHQYWCELNCED